MLVNKLYEDLCVYELEKKREIFSKDVLVCFCEFINWVLKYGLLFFINMDDCIIGWMDYCVYID